MVIVLVKQLQPIWTKVNIMMQVHTLYSIFGVPTVSKCSFSCTNIRYQMELLHYYTVYLKRVDVNRQYTTN